MIPTMNRTLLPAALLPFLLCCDAWQGEREARSACEQGVEMLLRREQRLSGPELSPAERKAIRQELTEALIQLRVGIARYQKLGSGVVPPTYIGAMKRVEALLVDPRVLPKETP